MTKRDTNPLQNLQRVYFKKVHGDGFKINHFSSDLYQVLVLLLTYPLAKSAKAQIWERSNARKKVISFCLECVPRFISIIYFSTKRKLQSESFLAFYLHFLKQTNKQKNLKIVLVKLKENLFAFLGYFMYPINDQLLWGKEEWESFSGNQLSLPLEAWERVVLKPEMRNILPTSISPPSYTMTSKTTTAAMKMTNIPKQSSGSPTFP